MPEVAGLHYLTRQLKTLPAGLMTADTVAASSIAWPRSCLPSGAQSGRKENACAR